MLFAAVFCFVIQHALFRIFASVFFARVAHPIVVVCLLLCMVSVGAQVALVARGGSSFADKVRVLQSLGAAAIIVSQNCDVWPYTMMDSATSGTGCSIPAVMIRQDHGAR